MPAAGFYTARQSLPVISEEKNLDDYPTSGENCPRQKITPKSVARINKPTLIGKKDLCQGQNGHIPNKNLPTQNNSAKNSLKSTSFTSQQGPYFSKSLVPR